MYKSNCHTHTNYCDGKNTAREMIESAIEKGFISLGFSGHSPMTGENDWTMSLDATKLYSKEIRELKKEYADKIDILCGIELDNNYIGVDCADFDYVIGSVHQLRKCGKVYEIDYTAEVLKKAVDELFGGSFNEMSKFYYNTVADFIIRENIDVVGHIDLITKFNLETVLFDETDEQYRTYARNAVDRIISAKPNILFEVNTGAMYRMGKKEPYPAEFLLSYIKKKGGKITLTSDSHCTESLDFAFSECIEFIRSCGFSHIYYLKSDGIKKYNLD